jgi:hypothetical protein
VVHEVEVDLAVEPPGGPRRQPLPRLVVGVQPRLAGALHPADRSGRVDAMQVHPAGERLAGKEVVQQRDAVLPGEHPDLVPPGGGEQDPQAHLLLGALAGLAGVRREQDLHRQTLPPAGWRPAPPITPRQDRAPYGQGRRKRDPASPGTAAG